MDWNRKRKAATATAAPASLPFLLDALFTVDESPLLKHLKEDHPTYQRFLAKNVGYNRVMCLLQGLERLKSFSSSERPKTSLEVITHHLCSILGKIRTEGVYAWGSDGKDNLAMLLFITDESTNWPFCLFIETVEGWIEESAGEEEWEKDIVRCDKLLVAMQYLADLIRGNPSFRVWGPGYVTFGWMKIAKKVLEHEINHPASDEDKIEDKINEYIERLETEIPEWEELFACELDLN